MISKLLDLNNVLAYKMRQCIEAGILNTEEASIIITLLTIRQISQRPLPEGWAQTTIDHLFEDVEEVPK